MVACFTRPAGAEQASEEPRFADLLRLVETGHLSALADLRYIFAKKTASGKTHVVAAWTDGRFNPYSLFLPEGDAPGSDLPGVPRPERVGKS